MRIADIDDGRILAATTRRIAERAARRVRWPELRIIFPDGETLTVPAGQEPEYLQTPVGPVRVISRARIDERPRQTQP